MPSSGLCSFARTVRDNRFAAIALIVAAWAMLFLPAITATSLHFEEGRRGAQAQAILKTGELVHLQIYGIPYTAKPPLLPAMMAATAYLRGGTMDEWSVRLPPALITLCGALLVYWFARRHGGGAAGLLAAAGFLLSWLVMKKAALGETDMAIVVAQFAALAIWWTARQRGTPGLLPLIACGLILAVSAMAKGPLGVLYFAAAVLVFHALRREWRSLGWLLAVLVIALLPFAVWATVTFEPGQVHRWRYELRMLPVDKTLPERLIWQAQGMATVVIQQLPWLAVAASGLLPAARRRALGLDTQLIGMLVLYASAFTAVLLVWPGTAGRYAMPVVPAIAVISGLAVAAAWGRNRWADASFAIMVAVLAVFQLVMVWAVPQIRGAEAYETRTAGREIARIVAADDDPVYATADVDENMLFYIGMRVHFIGPDDVSGLRAPAWIITAPSLSADLHEQLPGLEADPDATVASRNDKTYLLYRLN